MKYQGSEIYLIVSVCVGSILIGGTFVCVMTLFLFRYGPGPGALLKLLKQLLYLGAGFDSFWW